MKDGVTFDPASLRRFCTRHLSPLKHPARFIPIEGLPRGSTGKVLKALLPKTEDQRT